MTLVTVVFFWLGLVAALVAAALDGACFLVLDGAAAPARGFLVDGASAMKRVGAVRARFDARAIIFSVFACNLGGERGGSATKR